MRIADVEKFMTGRRPGAIGQRKDCAVLIPLIERDGKMHILFERRSSKMKTQPGDVCFPGGRMDPGESPQECALRETEEEIGIPRERIRVLGQFDSIYEVSNLTMNTVIGVIDEANLEHMQLKSRTVQEVGFCD